MNFFTCASTYLAKEDAYVAQHAPAVGRPRASEMARNQTMSHFRRTCALGAVLLNEFKTTMGEADTSSTDRWWWVTYRPAPLREDATLDDYNAEGKKLADATREMLSCRTWVDDYVWTIEQKGTSLETLGHGFHVHFLVRTRQPPKKVDRYVRSGLKVPNACPGFNIAICKDEHLANRVAYMLDYKSKDGHKLVTKDWDAQWRAMIEEDPIAWHAFSGLAASSGGGQLQAS